VGGAVRSVRRPGGIDLPYVVLGPEAGKRLVFAPSLLAAGTTSGAVFEPLVERGWCVLTMDQRGHGGATAVVDVEGFALAAMGADLLAMMDDAGWESAWLGGGSLGAATSLAAAAQAPDRVEGLALLAPAIGRSPSAARRDRFGPIARAFADGGTEAGIAAWTAGLAGGGAPAPHHEAAMRSTDPRVLAALLEALSTWTMAEELASVAGLDVPVVVMAWDGDDIHPMSVAEDVVAAARHGRLHRIRATDTSDPLGLFATLAHLLGGAFH
jgi:pimeloyl-ACP methyl ester carboxylesterase